MTDDFDVPEHDPLSQAARRALGRLGDTPELDELSWGAVQSRARRVKAQRISAVVAACAVVVVGLGAVVATAKEGSNHVSVAGRRQNSTTTSAPTTTVAPTTTSTTPVLSPIRPISPPATQPPGAAQTTAPGSSPVVQPQGGSWQVAITADTTRVTAGDDFVVSAELTNTGTQLQSTDGYGSWAIACSWADQSTTDPGPSTLPIGQFPEGAILRPGESQSFSATFHADISFVGSLRCGAGVVFHGDAQAADTGNGVVVEVIAPPATTTTVTPPASTTSTTAP